MAFLKERLFVTERDAFVQAVHCVCDEVQPDVARTPDCADLRRKLRTHRPRELARAPRRKHRVVLPSTELCFVDCRFCRDQRFPLVLGFFSTVTFYTVQNLSPWFLCVLYSIFRPYTHRQFLCGNRKYLPGVAARHRWI